MCQCRFLSSNLASFSVTIIAVLFAAVPASADHAKTDIVTTDDGNTFIGEIRSVQNATLNLKTGAAGSLTIPWRRVTSLTSQFEYRIELTGGLRKFGSLGPQPRPGYLSVVSESANSEVKLADVFQIVPIEDSFWRRFNGSLNWGFSYTQANSVLQYNFNADASYRTRRNHAELTVQSIFSAQEDGEVTNQHYLQFIMAQPLKNQWGAFELGQVQANPDQGYDQRYIVGGGAFNFLIERSSQYLAWNLGAVYNREYVTGSSDIDDSAKRLSPSPINYSNAVHTHPNCGPVSRPFPASPRVQECGHN
jgi:hypothetical protein